MGGLEVSHAQPHGKRFIIKSWKHAFLFSIAKNYTLIIPTLSQLPIKQPQTQCGKFWPIFKPKQLKNQTFWVSETHIAICRSNPFTSSSLMSTMLLQKILLHPSIVATCLPGGSGDSLVICLAADSTGSLHWLVEYPSCLTGVSEAKNKN